MLAQKKVPGLSDSSALILPPDRFPALDLVRPDLNARYENGDFYVQDALRHQRLLLTPEEWVRQHVLHWLLYVSGFPASLLSVERMIGKTLKRADVVGYNRSGNPLLLVECKAPTEPIDQETVRQAVVYNQQLKCLYIWLTNGLVHRVLNIEGELVVQLGQLPHFSF